MEENKNQFSWLAKNATHAPDVESNSQKNI